MEVSCLLMKTLLWIHKCDESQEFSLSTAHPGGFCPPTGPKHNAKFLCCLDLYWSVKMSPPSLPKHIFLSKKLFVPEPRRTLWNVWWILAGQIQRSSPQALSWRPPRRPNMCPWSEKPLTHTGVTALHRSPETYPKTPPSATTRASGGLISDLRCCSVASSMSPKYRMSVGGAHAWQHLPGSAERQSVSFLWFCLVQLLLSARVLEVRDAPSLLLHLLYSVLPLFPLLLPSSCLFFPFPALS